MSDLVGHTEDRFSQNEADIMVRIEGGELLVSLNLFVWIGEGHLMHVNMYPACIVTLLLASALELNTLAP